MPGGLAFYLRPCFYSAYLAVVDRSQINRSVGNQPDILKQLRAVVIHSDPDIFAPVYEEIVFRAVYSTHSSIGSIIKPGCRQSWYRSFCRDAYPVCGSAHAADAVSCVAGLIRLIEKQRTGLLMPMTLHIAWSGRLLSCKWQRLSYGTPSRILD